MLPATAPLNRQLCALARQHAAAVAFIAALLADDAPDLEAARAPGPPGARHQSQPGARPGPAGAHWCSAAEQRWIGAETLGVTRAAVALVIDEAAALGCRSHHKNTASIGTRTRVFAERIIPDELARH